MAPFHRTGRALGRGPGSGVFAAAHGYVIEGSCQWGGKYYLVVGNEPAGTTIQASGQGFAPDDQINLYLNQVNGTLLASAAADSSGNLPATNITVPSQPTGQYTVVAMQAQSGISASTNLSVVPIFSFSKDKVQPDSLLRVVGAGFASQDFVDFFLDTVTIGYSFARAESDASGNISASVYLPFHSVLPGRHIIIAKSDITGDLASFPVTFLPRVFPVVGKAGLPAQLHGASFAANEMVQVYWGTQTGQLEGSTTTDATGNLWFSFTAPSGLTPGSYPITIVRSHHKPVLVSTQFRVIPVTMISTPGIRSGQSVKVKLSGFLPYEWLTFSWNANGGQQIGTAGKTDKNGAFQVEIVPPFAPLGSYTLTVIGNTSGLQASSSLNVGTGIYGDYGEPGGKTTVTGGGFSAGETVNVYFQKPENGIVPVTTDASGSFTVQLPLPSTYNPATTYYIHAVSTTGSEHAVRKFTFYPLSLSTNGYAYYNQSISFTGSNFAVNEVVDILWNYQHAGQYTITTVKADSTGNFNINLLTPSTPNQSNITVAAVGTTSKLVATTSLVSYPAIYDNPSLGTKGTKVAMSGGGFGSAETITLSLQGLTVATVTSKSDGSFTASFKMPAASGAGNVIIQASGGTSGITEIAPFTYTPLLAVTPTVIHNGDTIIITGKHFGANTSINLYWPISSSNQDWESVATDANGSFTTTIQISGLTSGAYNIMVNDWSSGLFIYALFVVQ